MVTQCVTNNPLFLYTHTAPFALRMGCPLYVMLKTHHVLTCCLFLGLFGQGHAADGQIEKRFSVGRNVGEVVVRYEPKAKIAEGYSNGNLVFYWPPFSTPFQSTETSVLMSSPQIDVFDVNGDGYNDVIFYNQYTGYAGSPTRGARVFMYVQKLRRFALSNTLSDRGEIQEAKTKGCVLVEYKSGPTGYTTEEWCFNLKMGRWKMVRSEGGEAERE